MELLSMIDIKTFLLVASIILFIHEMEEWNIDKYHKQNYIMNGVVETKLGVRLWLFFLSGIGFVWCFISIIIPSSSIAVLVYLPLSIFALLNGIQHILITIIKRHYNPGLIFGGIFGVGINIIIIIKVIRDELLPIWIVSIFIGILVIGIVKSIKESGNKELPGILLGIIKVSKKLENIMSE